MMSCQKCAIFSLSKITAGGRGVRGRLKLFQKFFCFGEPSVSLVSMPKSPSTHKDNDKSTVKFSGSRETSVFCLVRRGGGKVGVPRGEGRVGGSREVGGWVVEGGMLRLFVCNNTKN